MFFIASSNFMCFSFPSRSCRSIKIRARRLWFTGYNYQLNGKTKVEEYTQSAWDDHTVRFYKIGNIVICVNTAAHTMPQANFKASYCSIPSACRPITRAYTAINEWDGHQYASTAEAMVEANGDMIYYRTSSAENRERNFTLVWLTS